MQSNASLIAEKMRNGRRWIIRCLPTPPPLLVDGYRADDVLSAMGAPLKERHACVKRVSEEPSVKRFSASKDSLANANIVFVRLVAEVRSVQATIAPLLSLICRVHSSA